MNVVINLAILIAIKLFHISSSAKQQSNSTLSTAPSCPHECTCLRNASQIVGARCKVSGPQSLIGVLNELPKNLRQLAFEFSHLRSISDICCFTALKLLDVSNNEIEIILSYSDPGPNNFENVQQLNLASNRISYLRHNELISFPNLETLNLAYNRINVIHAETFKLLALKRLHLEFNKIEYVEERIFRFTPKLEWLDFSNNKLSRVQNRNFYYLKKLQMLNVSNNLIKLFDRDILVPMINLNILNLSNNQLTRFPLESIRHQLRLSTLILDGNPIRLLEEDDVDSEMISITYLSMNDMPSFEMILHGSLSYFTNLTHLSIRNCSKFKYFSSGAFAIKPNPDPLQLSSIDLRNNGLQFVPEGVLNQQSLLSVDISGNPLWCECFPNALRDRKVWVNQKLTKCISQLDGRTYELFLVKFNNDYCRPVLFPFDSNNTRIFAKLGDSVRLYCSLLGSSDSAKTGIKWILPSGKSLSVGSHTRELGNIVISLESLSIAQVSLGNDGIYRCQMTTTSNANAIYSDYQPGSSHRIVRLTVQVPDVALFPVVHGSQLSLTWNRSRIFTDSENFRILYKQSNSDDDWVWRSGLSWHTYIFELKPHTNYTFCLAYLRLNVTVHQRCTSVRTRSSSLLTFGITLNYTLIGLVAALVSFVVAICIARCLHRRLHIWQREKWHSRMQESLSGQGFISSSSADSLNHNSNLQLANSLESVTYENPQLNSCSSPRVESAAEMNSIASYSARTCSTALVDSITDNSILLQDLNNVHYSTHHCV